MTFLDNFFNDFLVTFYTDFYLIGTRQCFLIFFIFFFSVILFSLLEGISFSSQLAEELNRKRTALYGYEHPERIAANIYIPSGVVDVSMPPYYYAFISYMTYVGCELVIISCTVTPIIGIFSIHIKGE